jgi:hypothetical protein
LTNFSAGRTITTLAEDADSQWKYGEFEAILSTGERTQEQSDLLAAQFLADAKDPRQSIAVTGGGDANPTVTIGILGYYHLLDLYSYNSTATSSIDLDAHITNILAAEPNGVFGGVVHNISANAVQVNPYTVDDKTAKTLIFDMLPIGDSSGNLYNFGMYEDFRFTYEAVPDAVPDNIAYTRSVRDRDSSIRTSSGGTLEPFLVRPGRWLLVTDITLMDMFTDLRDSPGAMLVESVSYTAPHGVSVSGAFISRASTVINQVGANGMAQ